VSPAPNHGSLAGTAYLALRKLAREQGRATDELLQLYVLESFVDRLASSAWAHDLVLKGGVLLSAYDTRRPTRDVDLSAQRLANDPAAVGLVIESILALARDDGWAFGAVTTETIREEDAYSGVRVTVPCSLATARMTFHVDVNVGDVVWPAPIDVVLPRLLGGEIRARGYPLVMVLAEKMVTAVERGTINTRWRDFADVLLLSRAHRFVGDELVESVRRVSAHRGAPLRTLASALAGYASLGQGRWSAWVRKQRLGDRLPVDFGEVLAEVLAFADPVLSGVAVHSAWDCAQRAWVASRIDP